MRLMKVWLLAALVGAAGGGFAVMTALDGPARADDRRVERRVERREDRREARDHWRYHDGRWSMWSAADKRWYYTDGSHWFYHDGGVWKPYRFDKTFGREGFERGGYKAPGEGIKIVLPRHKVYIGPRD